MASTAGARSGVSNARERREKEISALYAV